MFLNIITPTRDGKNLNTIAKSINLPKENYKWIVIFDLDSVPNYPKPENTEFYCIKDPNSISGNSQRNHGLTKVENGFIFFLDDDTLLHPLIWDSIKDLSDDLDFISFDQAWNTHGDAPYDKKNIINNNKVIRTKGHHPELDRIDSGNFIVNWRIAKQLTWNANLYNADGVFCLECFNLSKQKLYIPRILSVYNLLDKKRIYNIPFETGWVALDGNYLKVEDTYYDYFKPKYEHIYHLEQFGESWFFNESLYSYMVETCNNNSVFVEVGSWKGKSSAYMAVEIANSEKNILFYCVDTWTGSKEHQSPEYNLEELFNVFSTNMQQLQYFYSPLRMYSCEASKLFKDESIDFIYIDASHEYEDVKDDINHWLPKLKTGGIIAGDDYGNPDFPGVHRAVFELLDGYEVKRGTWIFRK